MCPAVVSVQVQRTSEARLNTVRTVHLHRVCVSVCAEQKKSNEFLFRKNLLLQLKRTIVGTKPKSITTKVTPGSEE